MNINTLINLSPEVEQEISKPFQKQKTTFVKLFESYNLLGFSRRKKRMRLFQQLLQNKRYDRKLKKLKQIVESEKENTEVPESPSNVISLPRVRKDGKSLGSSLDKSLR